MATPPSPMKDMSILNQLLSSNRPGTQNLHPLTAYGENCRLHSMGTAASIKDRRNNISKFKSDIFG